MQAVLVVEGILRRPFGLASLRVEVAGFKAEAAAAQTLFPLLRRRDVPGFLAALLPEHAAGLDGLAPPPPRAWRRYLLPPALAGLALGAAPWVALPAAGPWPLALALPGAAAGVLARRAAGWRLRDGRRRRALAAARAGHRARAGAARSSRSRARSRCCSGAARLADLAVAVGAGTRARVRHLDERVAAGAYDALRDGVRPPRRGPGPDGRRPCRAPG